MNRKSKQRDPLRTIAGAQPASVPATDGGGYSVDELLHDLQVHQIELEMQNEELRRNRLDLEIAHDRYADLYEFAPVGYLTLSSEAKIEAMNLTGAVLLGEDRKQLLKRRFAHFIVVADRERWLQYFTQAMQQGDRHICELSIQRRDGTVFEARLDGVATVLGGTVPALRIALSDISDRNQLDRQLQEKNAELERAKLVAEQANRAKSVFLSNMSHELRTPLNAILGFAQLMESSSPPPTDTQNVRLKQITDAGWYLLHLINEILDLAAIESGKLVLTQESVAITDVMRESAEMVEPLAQKHGIQVNYLPSECGCFVQADRTRLKQVMLNLLSNAVKYNREQGTVEVKCSVCLPDRVRISIKDSGAGLPPESLAQLFQPFNRLGQENKHREGTGIGLVMARQMVELMGGSLSVESTIGIGSEFWFELPGGIESAPVATAEQNAEQTPPEAAKSAQRTLLCAEDNPVNMMLLEQIVAGLPQVRMLTAREGNLCIAQARAHRPDVVLLDVNLPDISGIEVLKTLREDPATAHIPVIGLSANGRFHEPETGRAAGFFRYLTKPVNINELASALKDALKLSEAGLPNATETGEKR